MHRIINLTSIIFTLFIFSGCSGCSSNKNETSWYDYFENEDSDDNDGNGYDCNHDDGNGYFDSENKEVRNKKGFARPTAVDISPGVSLAEAGRAIYTDLLDWEERFGFGGVKLCAEMSADQDDKFHSSFYEPTTIMFRPPSGLHLKKINVITGSSNIISRIVNGEIEVSVGTIQTKIFRQPEEVPFYIDVVVRNRIGDDIAVTIPQGQMLEVSAPNVQNIVVNEPTAISLSPYQTKTIRIWAYCAAEKRKDPTYKQAKLTPFVLTAPSYAYNSQQSLWSFLKTKPVTDKYYTITFYAWGSGSDNCIGGKSDFGHAFVDIPEIGTVGYGGIVTDHTDKVRCARYQVSINVNETSLRKAQYKYWQWQNSPPAYELMQNDCTTFTMDIADAAGIYYGFRWLIQSPAGFLKELKTYN